VRKIFQDKGSWVYGQAGNPVESCPKPVTAQQGPGSAP
jgi:hypothetical protein